MKDKVLYGCLRDGDIRVFSTKAKMLQWYMDMHSCSKQEAKDLMASEMQEIYLD